MKKLLAVLGSIGLASTATSAVVACGDGGKSNVDDKDFVVNPDSIVNGNYDVVSKTFTSTCNSSKYETNKLKFSLTKVALSAKNIVVTTTEGENIDSTSGRWSFKVEDSKTVITIEDASLNNATLTIQGVKGYRPTTFKIVVPQDADFVISNVANGIYDTSSKVLIADSSSSKYNGHNLRFSLENVSLTENNIVVTQSNGVKVKLNDKQWTFIALNNTTTFYIADYLLNGATFQIKDVEGYNSLTFKIVIKQDENIVISDSVINGSYNMTTKTFNSEYGSSQYDDHKMSFTINDLALNLNNVVVKISSGETKTSGQGWGLTTNDNTTTITIDDYNLNHGTIMIQDVDGYWPVTFNLAINQDSDMIPTNIVNGSYDDNAKTMTATYSSSKYAENKMSFTLANVSLDVNNLVVIKADGTSGNESGLWTLNVNDNSTTVTINDGSLNGATITVQDVKGYWPLTFNLEISQDQEIVVDDNVDNGSYDVNNKTFSAEYGSSKYNDEQHMLTFSLTNVNLTADEIIVKDSNGQTVASSTSSWEFWISDGGINTVLRIRNSNLNNATITIEDVDGYWPVTFNLAINQDSDMIPTNIVNGSYDDNAKIMTATYSSSKYAKNKMSFTLANVSLDVNNLVAIKADGTSGNESGLWTLNVNDNSTTVTINDGSLNGATITVQDVKGYWPLTFNLEISQDQEIVVDDNVDNGSYDASTKTFSAEYGSSEYNDEQHMLTFSLKDINLTADEIIVKDSNGQIVASDGWDTWISDGGINTVLRIRNSNLNNATITIEDETDYWPVTFKVMIHQDKKIAFNQSNVINGSYDDTNGTITANVKDSDYANKKVAITFNDLTLSEANVVVKDNSGSEVSINTGLWSFKVEDSKTIITIEDASLSNANLTIQGVKGYWPLALKLVINPATKISLNDAIVTNATLDETNKTLTAKYGSSQYEDHNLSVFIPNIVATSMNVEVKDSNGHVIELQSGRFEISTDGGGITITIVDSSLNGATITLSGVIGYYPITFKVIIAQDKEIVVRAVYDAVYDSSTNTFTAQHGSSDYKDHHINFFLEWIDLKEENIVITNKDGNIVNLSSDFWYFWPTDSDFMGLEIKDTSLNGATIQIKDVGGYWPVTFTIVIPQN